MGRSIGTSVAIELASSVSCQGLILISPFLSLLDAVSRYVGVLAPFLVGNMFANEEYIKNVKVPTLVIHGMRDRLVPCEQGERLSELCQGRKLFVCPKEMGHNSDLLRDADFLVRPMLRFFSLPDYAFVDLQVPGD